MTPSPSALLLALCLAAGSARAACVAEAPLESARWFFQNHYYFYQQRTDDAAALLSPELRTAMERQWRCATAACALADPWTNLAGASVRDPIVFSLRNSPPERTRVAMRFVLAHDDAGEPASAELIWVRDSGSGCWVLDELLGANGLSLRNTLGEGK